MAIWKPTLAAAHGTPLYQRLVEAMAADVESGALAPGTRLPTQRDLAYRLSISVGAVTRAYDEAARRGLVAAHVGRGTFVAGRSHAMGGDEGIIDLSINTAPIARAAAIAQGIAALRRPIAWAERLDYQPPFGLDADRRAGAAWLQRTAGFNGLDWRQVLCCSGAQNAMAIALAALCRPGDVVLCETASFSGFKSLADQMGYRLRGVEMDAQGAHPDALERAAAETGARVFYTLPTLHNPTARTMDGERRAAIVDIARARDLWLVEDDVYAPYARRLGLPPLAAMAPERTLYVSSLSKILSPGLRAGFLVAPSGEPFDRCVRAMRALMHSPAGISGAIATRWIESGRADDLAREIIAETCARTTMARTALGDLADEPRTGMSLHLWLPMREIEAERAVARAATTGLRLTSPEAFAVSGRSPVSGLRLCIGGAASRALLERALLILKEALDGGTDDRVRALL